MPFCSQCGNQVGPADGFCGRCGGRQPSAQPPPPLGSGAFSAILCYVPGIGWIASILVLASERFRRDRKIRFHAFQGLYLFVGWLMVDWVLKPMFSPFSPASHLHQILQTALLVAAIFMMVKASHNETYALPLFGELAQRSIMED